jgi:protein SCO1
MKNVVTISLVILGLGMLIGGYFIWGKDQEVRKLNYFNPIEKGLAGQQDAQGRHVVSDFELIDQTGKTVTRADFKNSITVVDFFFTSCKGICPVMNSQMERVYKAHKGNPEVKLISHTVNPENDSAEVMAAYAARYHADPKQWYFLTGDKPQLYSLARKSYLISDTEGNGSKEDFVHSQNFALIDKTGHIRGIYNGTDTTDVDRLLVEMNILLREK